MFKSLLPFSVSIFLVWYFPAITSALTQNENPIYISLMAGLVVSLPLCLISTLGAIAGFYLVRTKTSVVMWQSALFGFVAGVISQVVTATKSTFFLSQYATEILSPIPVLLRVLIIGLAVSFIMFSAAKLKKAKAG